METTDMTTPPTRAGIAALLGLPNAGKSTLVNRLVGQKVSIVTPKAQTTRFRIRGVCMDEQTQIVLTDTPGLFFDKQAFNKAMFKEAEAGLSDSDALVVVVDATKHASDYLERALQVIFKQKRRGPVALALNKVDAADKEHLLKLAASLNERYQFDATFMVSAARGSGVADLRNWLSAQMPEGPFLYNPEDISDLPMRHLAAEVTREQCFILLQQEIPYAVHVLTELWEDKGETLAVISQLILVTRESHKKLVIGKGGSMLKRIGVRARTDLEQMLQKKVHLTLHVKVDARWQEKMVRLGLHPDQYI